MGESLSQKADKEIKESLKFENKELKTKIEWLNKDIEFKTQKLNEFLDDNAQKATEISNLRTKATETESEFQMLQSTNDSLQQQLIHLKLSYESTKKHLDEERQQLS